MSGSVNLALLTQQERNAMAVDLIAKRLIHYRKAQGKEWRQWAVTEISKLSAAYQQPVKDRLNELLKPGATNESANSSARQAQVRPAQQDRGGVQAAPGGAKGRR